MTLARLLLQIVCSVENEERRFHLKSYRENIAAFSRLTLTPFRPYHGFTQILVGPQEKRPAESSLNPDQFGWDFRITKKNLQSKLVVSLEM